MSMHTKLYRSLWSGSSYEVLELVTRLCAKPSKQIPPFECIGPKTSVPSPKRISLFEAMAYLARDGMASPVSIVLETLGSTRTVPV